MGKPINSLPVKITLLVVSTLTAMSGATIAPSLPVMREHFSNVANADYLVRLVLTAPSLCVAIAAPFAGVMIDQIGRKPLLAVTLLVYGLAGSSGLWLNSLGLILVGRALLGLSVAGIMTTATTLIADYYTGSVRARFLGLQSASMALGGVVFLSVGGFLADMNWRMPFLIYLVAWVLLPLVLLFLPEPSRTSQSSTPQSGVPVEPDSLPMGQKSVNLRDRSDHPSSVLYDSGAVALSSAGSDQCYCIPERASHCLVYSVCGNQLTIAPTD